MTNGRLAFVNLQVGKMTGVAKSISGQVAAAERQGLRLDSWIIGEAEPQRGVTVEAPASWVLRRFGSLVKGRVLASVDALDDYDAIVLRYPGGVDLDPLALLRRCTRPIVTVHHTKEIAEILSGGRTLKSLSRAGLEWFNGQRILRRVAGVVGVTDEIRDYEVRRSGKALPASTIANGIDVERVAFTRAVPFDGARLRLLFIAGSHAPWHGTDRLIASVARYRGSTALHLDMVGATSRPPGSRDVLTNATIEYHGLLSGVQLDECFRRASVAFSSLAMFRNGLSQGCVLKTREYVARGLPLVIGYDDVDLRGHLPWVLRVPNTDEPIDLNVVIDFARTVAREQVSDEMRAFAARVLTWDAKVTSLVEFVRSVSTR